MPHRKLESYRLAPLSDLNGRPGSACSASGIADFSDMSDPTPCRFKRFSSGLASWELWLFDERVGDARVQRGKIAELVGDGCLKVEITPPAAAPMLTCHTAARIISTFFRA
jgi:hypothetical protein